MPENMVLTDRDVEVLKALNRYRYLTTSQIQKLIFGLQKTPQPARRRLRLLRHFKYVSLIRPYMRVGDPKPEHTYTISKQGKQALIERGVEKVYLGRKSNRVKHAFLEHARLLSDFRVNLELAIEASEHYHLDRFTPDFELIEDLKDQVNHFRYKTYTQINHPVTRRTYRVHPDGLIVLRAEKDGKEIGKRLIFVEIDRSTESQTIIYDKLTGYQLYKELKIFEKFADVKDFLLLFQVESERRAKGVLETIVNHQAADFTRIAVRDQVTENSIIQEPIWRNHAGLMTALTKKSLR